MSRERTILKDVGKILRKRINEKYKSVNSFAEACEISEGTVRNILSGRNITLNILDVVCGELEIKVSELLKQAGH